MRKALWPMTTSSHLDHPQITIKTKLERAKTQALFCCATIQPPVFVSASNPEVESKVSIQPTKPCNVVCMLIFHFRLRFQFALLPLAAMTMLTVSVNIHSPPSLPLYTLQADCIVHLVRALQNKESKQHESRNALSTKCHANAEATTLAHALPNSVADLLTAHLMGLLFSSFLQGLAWIRGSSTALPVLPFLFS